jgi:Fur family zinc uptake transcriptional regulator
MSSVTAQLDAAATQCAANGAQLTALRRAVLELILAAHGPLTAYQLLDQLKATRKSAMPPTVYRALEFLSEQKLIHRLERLNAFVPCTDTGHAHDGAQFLICRGCGSVTEMEDHEVSHALAAAAARHGFTPSHAIVELDGLCAACFQKDCAARAST